MYLHMRTGGPVVKAIKITTIAQLMIRQTNYHEFFAKNSCIKPCTKKFISMSRLILFLSEVNCRLKEKINHYQQLTIRDAAGCLKLS